MVTMGWDSSQSRPSFLESWAHSLVFLWMAQVFEEGDSEVRQDQARVAPLLPGRQAKAEALLWAGGEHTNCLTDTKQTDMGTGWEKSRETVGTGSAGGSGQKAGRWESGPRV